MSTTARFKTSLTYLLQSSSAPFENPFKKVFGWFGELRSTFVQACPFKVIRTITNN